jgi:hypothetical protein
MAWKVPTLLSGPTVRMSCSVHSYGSRSQYRMGAGRVI